MASFKDFLGPILNLIGAGAGAYGAKQQADATKFQNKPIDLTPQEKWLFNEQQRNYYSSPSRDYIGALVAQYLKNMYGQGVQGAGGFQPSFMTDRFKGMGLPQGPQFDFSGLPEKPWNPGTQPPPGLFGPPAKPGMPGGGPGKTIPPDDVYGAPDKPRYS